MISAVREFWIETLLRVVNPVFDALSEGKLRELMPVENLDNNTRNSPSFGHLEAVGRCLAGVAPWFACTDVSGEEAELREELFQKVVRGLQHAVDPDSPDKLNFLFPENLNDRQPLVDAAFLSHGFLRSGGRLWKALPEIAQERLVKNLIDTRQLLAPPTNWLLFASTVELFLRQVGADWDAMRVDAAVRAHEEWFLGDGWYGDGPGFATNYYNSFVIQPMLLEALDVMRGDPHFQSNPQAIRDRADQALQRAQRHAHHLVRMIAPDGSFPPLGRSLTYRCGAFQLLAQLAWEERLPESIAPAEARTGLTRAIRRTLTAPGTFSDEGWLNIGLCGHQRHLAESYINTGSLYLCTTAFLPLGLPVTAPFWAEPHLPTPWEELWSPVV